MWCFMCGRIIPVIIKYIMFYGIVLGYTSKRFCNKDHCFSSTKLTRFVATLTGVFHLILTPIAIWDLCSIVDYPESFVMRITRYVVAIMRCLNITYQILRRRSRDTKLIEIYKRLKSLDDIYFSKLQLDVKIEKYMFQLYVLKSIFTAPFYVYAGLFSLINLPHLMWKNVVCSILIMNALNIVHLAGVEYHLVLWIVHKRLCYIQRELEYIMSSFGDHISQEEGLSAEWINHMANTRSTHMELIKIMINVNDIFDVQLIFQRLNISAINIANGYILLCYLYTYDAVNYLLFFTALGMFMNLANNYLTDYIGYLIEKSNKDMLFLLQAGLSETRFPKKVLQLYDGFNMQLNNYPVKVDILSVYVLNKAFFFQTLTEYLSYILVLWQAHLAEIYAH